jgi:putative transferase (TIGR04331 family)
MRSEPLQLVTTADERTWPTEGPVLWLGDWCQLYIRRNVWESLGGEVIPYHWRDRGRLEQDYQYLDTLYEETLSSLVAQLNRHHGRSYSTRYWRILVGPWLAYFTHILYDKWLSIHTATSNYQISGTTVHSRANVTVAPNDMSDFLLLTRSDQWNSVLYGEIIEKFTSIPVAKLHAENAWDLPEVPVASPSTVQRARGRLFGVIKTLAYGISCRLTRSNDVFINTPYLSKGSLIGLFARLWQSPVIWRTVQAPTAEVNATQRNWSLEQAAKTDFEKYLLECIPQHLPRYCLEGFSGLLDRVSQLPWPIAPRALYTAGVLWHDVVCMAYFAEKIERGTPLIYGQHGGAYGTAKFHFARSHEAKISDRYLVWGRCGVEAFNEKVVGLTKLGSCFKASYARRQRLLFVTMNTSRYSYRLCSESARDFQSELTDSFSLVESLNLKVRSQVLVRLSPGELGWYLPQRWRDRFPELALEPGYSNIYELMRSSRLVLFNYNQTGFLETMAMNIPSLLCCDTARYPLRIDALPCYENLAAVGIWHASPEAAANHINSVWGNVDAWWSSARVQDAVSNFRSQFCELRPGLAGRVAAQIEAACER